MEEGRAKQILIEAPNLIGETLTNQLQELDSRLKISLSKDDLSQHPDLIIWFIDNLELPNSIQIELIRLKERWSPTPILLIIPDNIKLTTNELLQLECSGLVQDPSIEKLLQDIHTLVQGGRVLRIKERLDNIQSDIKTTIGLGQWLLISGLQQINDDLNQIDSLLKDENSNLIVFITLAGRKRELKAARKLLFLLWGTPQIAVSPVVNNSIKRRNEINKVYQTQINLNDRSPRSVAKAICTILSDSIKGELVNTTGSLLAIEAIKPRYKRDLLISLLQQADQALNKLNQSKNDNAQINVDWHDLQLEMRQLAVRSIIDNYVRLSKDGHTVALTDELIKIADFTDIDDELPNPELFLNPLIFDKPVLVEGMYLSADDPRALLHLQMLMSNWIIRTAEIISAELINTSAQWPELRNLLLNEGLISTRELEKFRNRLNSQNQWQSLIIKPIRIYESKRILYGFKNGKIYKVNLTETRDLELADLTWLQKQVALTIEARDALSPQVQSLVKHLGNLMVIILTKIVGRAIGLVGKGIAQGMGRSLSKG